MNRKIAPYQVSLKQGTELLDQQIIRPGEQLTIGREQCDLTVPGGDRTISRTHLEILFQEDGLFLKDLSTNGIFVDQQAQPKEELVEAPLHQAIRLAGTHFFVEIIPIAASESIAAKEPAAKKNISISEKEPEKPKQAETAAVDNKPNPKRIVIGGSSRETKSLADLLQRQEVVTIGRDTKCDILLPSLVVSREHAELRKTSTGAILKDTSMNGVFVNGQKIPKHKDHPVTEDDTIEIGPFKLSIKGQGRVIDFAASGEPAIIARSIRKEYPNGYVGLQRMSIELSSHEFVALMGPSGCGKSTLMKCLNGDNPPSEGSVIIQGRELNERNYKYIKRCIGYVPQDDIVHRELTVNQTLYFAAKLRLADDVTDQEIHRRISEVLTSLNINEPNLRKNRVAELSGGQRKRVSIAVELLSEPLVLFLDEPTSPLDPETIDDFLQCVRNLVRNGTTVIMVTHKPSDLEHVDKIIFLASGGYLTYCGRSEGMFTHFGRNKIVDIYGLLSNRQAGERYYKKLESTFAKPATKVTPKIENIPSESPWLQYLWLTRRYFQVKWNDKGNLVYLFLQPLIIGALMLFVFDQLRIGVLFLTAISAVWFGVNNASKEIVGEIPIYKRERMFNLSIFTYLFSKITVLSLLALVQVILFVLLLTLGFRGDESVQFRPFFSAIGFLFYLSFSATLLGLFLSASNNTTEKVLTLAPIVLIPQIMLAGIITKINTTSKEIISYFTLGRWGTEGLSRLQDQGTEQAEAWTITQRYNKDLELVQDTILSSVYQKITEVDPDGRVTGKMVDQKTGALDLLGMYSDDSLGYFQGLDGNYMAITLLNILVFFGIYVAMKMKDSIKSSFWVRLELGMQRLTKRFKF